MRTHTPPRRFRQLALAIGLVTALLLGACSDDGDEGDDAASAPTTTSTVANDPELAALLVRAEELPPTFAPVEEVGDTVPSFCAGEDPTARLQASGRAVVGYSRTPPGASVLHLVFRFDDDGAAAFVQQAREIIGRCSDVPDANGLAFTYREAPAPLTAAFAGVDDAVVTDGVSVGSGSLRSIVAVFRRGDLGAMVAVLAVDAAEGDAEAVALAAFTAAAANLPPPT